MREKIIGVSGVCVSDRANPPPRSAACVCRDPGESRGGSGAGRWRARYRGPFPPASELGGKPGGQPARGELPTIPQGGQVTKATSGGGHGTSGCPEDALSRDGDAALPLDGSVNNAAFYKNAIRTHSLNSLPGSGFRTALAHQES